MKRPLCLIVFSLALLAAASVGRAQAAEPKSYNIAGLADFSGPFADIMKSVVAGREAVIKWWNDTVGKELGVALTVKNYDTRYDPAQTASLWPGIRAELNPLVVMGVGSTDATALADRVAEAKIPMFPAGATTTGLWVPNGWLFYGRPTYANEAGGFLDWYYTSQKRTSPLRVAVISSQAAPAFVDMAKGVQAYAAQSDGKAEVVEIIWDAPQPTDLTGPMQRLVAANPDFIVIQTTTAAVVAATRALQALDKKIPVLTTSHNGMLASGKAIGGIDQLEGDYETYALPLSNTVDNPGYKFYELLKSKYGLTGDWSVLVAQGMSQGVLTVRAIEAAARREGGQDLTGEKVRNAVLSGPLTGNDGVFGPLTFDASAPFPSGGLTTNVGTIKDGKYVAVAHDLPMPNIKKW